MNEFEIKNHAFLIDVGYLIDEVWNDDLYSLLCTKLTPQGVISFAALSLRRNYEVKAQDMGFDDYEDMGFDEEEFSYIGEERLMLLNSFFNKVYLDLESNLVELIEATFPTSQLKNKYEICLVGWDTKTTIRLIVLDEKEELKDEYRTISRAIAKAAARFDGTNPYSIKRTDLQ